MSDTFIPFLPILIVLAGIGVVLGLPVGKWAKALIARWLLVAALLAIAPILFRDVWDYARHTPPRSLGEIIAWLGVFVVALSYLLRLLFGRGFAGRVASGIVSHAAYDLLKGMFRVTFKVLSLPFRRQPK